MKKGSLKKVLLSVLLSVMVINSFHGIGTYAEETKGEEVTETEDDVLNTEGLSVEGQKEGEFLNTALPANYEVVEKEEPKEQEEVLPFEEEKEPEEENTPEEIEEEEELLEETPLVNTPAEEVEEEEETLEEAKLTKQYVAPGNVTITVKKEWLDDKEEDRPEKVTVQIKRNSTVVGTMELTAENGWEGTLKDLPGVYDDYSIESIGEVTTSDAYQLVGKNCDLINATLTYTLQNQKSKSELVNVTVTKVWNDNNNEKETRPGSVTVKLKKNGTDTGKTVTLNNSNNWVGYFTGLEGNVDDYTVEEVVPSGYQMEGPSKTPVNVSNTSFTITNTTIPANVTITVSKDWDDNNNQYRPNSVYVKLMKDGKAVKGQTLDDSNNWTYTWKDLEGEPGDYTVEENPVSGYELVSSSKEISDTEVEYTLKNVLNTSTAVKVTKKWAYDKESERPTSVTVQLERRYSAVPGATIVLSDENGWEGSFENLPGSASDYSVRETPVPEGYRYFSTPTIENTTKTVAIENQKWFTLQITKEWEDDNSADRPYRIGFTIKGPETDTTYYLYNYQNWTTNLELRGSIEDYTIEEILSEGYVEDYRNTTIVDMENTSMALVNTKTTNVTVTKVWDDNDDQDGKRTDSVTVRLLKNGEATEETAELNEENEWLAVFKNLKFYEKGEEVKYSIEEVDVPDGYEVVIGDPKTVNTTATKVEVTNKHTPEVIEIPVEKVWEDDDDTAGKRPTSIEVKLLADGEEKDSLTLDESNSWKGSFKDLDKYSEGKEIEYTVTEEKVTDYEEPVIEGDAESGFTVTNKYVPEEVEFKVSKQDDLLGLEINGAEIEIKDSEGNVVDSWTSDGEPHPVKLKEGTYTFHEEAAPLGFAVVTDIEFKVNADGSIEIISTETTGDTRVEDGVLIVCDERDVLNEKPIVISKVDLNGEPVSGAQVQIFSKNDGNLMYEYTTDGGYETVKLVAGEYIFHEEVAPDGYKAVTDITFEVTENGEVKVIDAAGNTVKAEGELLTVTDQPETEPTPTPTPTPTSTPTPKKTTTTKTPTPYTGDNFNVWAWIALLGVGILLAGGSTYILKRR